MRLKDIPNEEKPRERLLKNGVNSLSNEELISILIGTGTRNESVKELSTNILSKIKNINNLKDLTINELTSINGVGKAKALTIIAAIELGKRVNSYYPHNKLLLQNTFLVHQYFKDLIGHEKQENFLVILLDNKNQLITHKIMFKGTDTQSLISPKEIYNYAIKERASRIIIMHNHPSGLIEPSQADIDITNRLIMAGQFLEIPLIDHIITNGNNYYSFYNTFSTKDAINNET